MAAPAFLLSGAPDWSNPLSILTQMGWLDLSVMFGLFLMSAWSAGVMLDRLMAFRVARRQSRSFAPAVAGALREGRMDEAVRIAERYNRSHLAKVLTAGLVEFQAHAARPADKSVEASRRALERAAVLEHTQMERGLGTLATIGSTAPFVGLFGTVIGIIHSFQSIAEVHSPGISAVSSGIAEALITTAAGLFVAIPAVFVYNLLLASLKRFDVEMDNISSEFVDYLMLR